MDIKAAEALAREYHGVQKDKLGRDYVDHHLRPVAAKLAGDDGAEVAGWLHDILESTSMTSEVLKSKDVPADVVRAIESVTKREDESYDDLITRAAADPLGRRVKLADNEVNRESNSALAQRDPDTAAKLLKKYERAHGQLQTHPSHLFIVHGKIGQVVHDAVIVPTDPAVYVERHWKDTLGNRPLPKPSEFTDGCERWGSSSSWLVDVASGGFTDVLARLRRALDDIRDAHPWRLDETGGPLGRRPLPLVVVPVLGIGHGGRGDDKGEVLDQLIRMLRDAVSTLPFDIALVTPDPGVYAAAQHTRRMHEERATERAPKILDVRARELAVMAKEGQLALFLGAGVSIPAGLPTWSKLVDQLAEVLTSEDRAALDELDITDRAQLIEQLKPEDFTKRVAKITTEAKTPSLVHTLLAALDVSQVVTTNYDTLFEKASTAAGHALDVVLPHQSALGQRRWILKMHGDVEHVDNIVLTRRHMVMYDAANRPSAALLQSLLLTKHLVIVGASMTDPNVVRLAHEVDAYRDTHGQTPRDAYGSVLDAGPSRPSQAKLWSGKLDWVDLTGMGIGSGPRALEIMLDRIGMFASRNTSWVLDERFEGLLDDQDRRLADQVRKFAANKHLQNETWQPLYDALIALGASRGK